MELAADIDAVNLCVQTGVAVKCWVGLVKTGNVEFAATGLPSDTGLILLPWQFVVQDNSTMQSFIFRLEH